MKNPIQKIKVHLLIAIGMIIFFAVSCEKDDPIVKKDPIITWSNQAYITEGTLLSTTQLNATADVAGSFIYTPAIGTCLNVGANQDLKVDFTPTDLTKYNIVSLTVKINVIDNSIPFNLQTANIPAGTFTMGSPPTEVDRGTDETQFTVTLSAFRMSKYEITNAQYAAFLNAKSIGSDGKHAAGTYPTEPLIFYGWGLIYTNNQWIPVVGYENHPVIQVTWYGATEFATYVGGTLPTEAQWEYACRAGTTTPFNTGNCLTNLQANYNWQYPYSTCTNTVTTRPDETQAVGNYAANAYGLFDMHGNASEWCANWSGAYPTSAQTNPTGPSKGSYRVNRGGCSRFHALFCRSASRQFNGPSDHFNIGFRVVFVP